MNRFDSEFSSRSRSVGRWLKTLALTALVAVGLLGSSSIVKAQYTVGLSASADPICAGPASNTTLTAVLNGGPIPGAYAAAAVAYAAPYAPGANAEYLALDDDEVSGQQQVNEVFRFYGSDIDLNANGFWIGSNGFITFHDDVNATQIVPRDLAAPGNGNTYHAIYICNADMSPQLAGDIWWEVQNDGNGDVLLVTYEGVPLYNSANPLVNSGLLVNVQAVLYLNGHGLTPGRIEIRVDFFPDNNIPAAPVDKQQLTIGGLNNCQPPINNGLNQYSQANIGADLDDVTYAWDPAAPNIAGSSVTFYYCGETGPCTTGGVVLATDNAAPFNHVWTPPAATTDKTYYFRAEMTLTNCNVVVSTPITVDVNAQPIAISLNGNQNVCEGGTVSYSVTPSIAGSQMNWSTTAPGAVIITSGAQNENADITYPGGGSNGGTSYNITVTEVGPAPTNCTFINTYNNRVTIFTTPVGPLNAAPDPICAVATGSNSSTFTMPAGYGNYAWSFITNTIGATFGAGTNVRNVNVFAQPVQPAAPATVTVQVIASNGPGNLCSATFQRSITVNPIPPARTLSQPTPSVCVNQNHTYTLSGAAQGGNTVAFSASGIPYTWQGGYVNGTFAAPLAQTIQWNAAGVGTINVTEQTANGCIRTHTINTTVNALPTPVVIGSNTPCQYLAPAAGNPSFQTAPNPMDFPYFTASPAGNGFRWVVTGGTIVSANAATTNALPNTATAPGGVGNGGTYNTGLTSVTVRWTGVGAQSISLMEQTTFGCQAFVTFNVTVIATPTAAQFGITGPGIAPAAAPCAAPGPGNVSNYSTTGGGGAHTINVVGGFISAVTAPFVINTPVEASGTGAVANAFTVTWGAAGTGSISDEYTVAGCASVETYTITINPNPTFQITAPPAPLCGNQVHQFAVANLVNGGGAPNYLWAEVSDVDGIGALGANGNSTMNVTFGNPPGATSNYTISCQVTNTNTGCLTINQLAVTIHQQPVAPILVDLGPYCASSPDNPNSATQLFAISAVGNLNITLPIAPAGSSVTSPQATGGVLFFNVTWGNVAQNPALAPQIIPVQVDATVTAVNGCTSPVGSANFNIEARPAPAPINTLPPLCVNTPVPINVNVTTNGGAGQPGVAYTWAASGVTLAGPGPGLNNQITNLGAAGNKSITVTATSLGLGCATATTTNFVVDPVPNPVIAGPTTACQDTTDPLGKPHLGSQFGFTYIYNTVNQVIGNTYAWTVSNGYIDAVSTDLGNTWINPYGHANVQVADVSNAPIVEANYVRVVFYGTTPGKVKVTETHPGGCAFTTLDYNVDLNVRPDIQDLTTDPIEICAGDQGIAYTTGPGSQVGYDYRIEISADGGTTWAPALCDAPANLGGVQAGTGGQLNWTISPTALAYTAVPPAVTNYRVRVTALQNGFNQCGWYIASDLEDINVNPKPAGNMLVVAEAHEECANDDIVILVGENGGIGTQPWVMYQLFRRQIASNVDGTPVLGDPFVAVGSAAPGNNGQISLTDNTNPAGAWPLLNTENYEYQVLAYTEVGPPPNISCSTWVADTAGVRVFALPTDPVLTITPNPVCWEEEVLVNLANTQEGVEYEILINGASIGAPYGPIIMQGVPAGNNPVSVVVNSVAFQPTNPVGSEIVTNIVARSYLQNYGIYNRPIPVGGCPTDYSTPDLTVLEKPVAEITGPDTVCGPSTTDYFATPVTPAPGTYDWLITGTPDAAPAGTTPLVANNTGDNTVNPYTVNWGVNLLSCDGSYNPLTTTIRLIATNANGCTDTAFKEVTINPTVDDAVITGDTMACIYAGFEEHLESYVITRQSGVNCVFPPGTEFLWTMPTGVVSGAIRSGQGTDSIVAEWYTTGGTNIGTVECQVTLPDSVGGCITTRTFDVIVYPLPQPVVNGPDDVCQGQQNVVYTADSYPSDTYIWEVLGGTVDGGTGTGIPGDLGTHTGVGLNVVTIDWLNEPNANAYIKLTQISVANCMNETYFYVTVHPNPVPSIDGPGAVCDNAVVSYSTADNAPNNVYNWSVTGNATIQTGTNQAAVQVLTGNYGAFPNDQFVLTLTERTLATGCETTVQRTISIYPTPKPEIVRLSPLPGFTGGACLGQEIEYGDTDPVAPIGSYNYKWTVLNGNLNALTPDNGATIKVTWNTVGTGKLTLMKWHSGTQCTTTVHQDVNITEIPQPAISGLTEVCGDDIQQYSTPFVVGNTYEWTVTGDATLISGMNSNVVTVEFSNPGTLTGAAVITVLETNTLSGCFAEVSENITVHYMPQADVIDGPGVVCNTDTTTYAVNGEIPGLEYIWTVSGGLIVANTGSSIDVEWATVGDHIISVIVRNPGTNCEITLEKVVTVEFQPNPAISGDAEVCEDEIEQYSTPYNPGSSYDWSVTGGLITSGQNSNVITVEWTTPGLQQVTVTESNASGHCVAVAVLQVLVHETPAADGIVRLDGGNVKHACEGYTYEYGTDAANPQNFDWEWSVTGGQFESPNDEPTVFVKWTLTGNQLLKVKITTPGTDCEIIVEEVVAVTPTPQPNIDGATVACINKDHVYQTPYVPGNTYEWEITPSNVFATITGYPNSNIIEVKWIQPGLHTVTLTETNVAGGCETTVSINVQVNLIPDPFITSPTGYGDPAGQRPGIVCNFSTHTYTTYPTPGNTWIWTVEGGTIIAGQYTNEIEVTWGPSGIGTIAVEETIPGSDCITTKLDSIDIRPTPTPVISGNFNPCGNSVETYSTPFVAQNSHTWTVVGGSIIAVNGSSISATPTYTGYEADEITIRWNSDVWPNTIAASITLTEWVTPVLPFQTCIATTSRNVTVRPNPPVPTITGPAVVCATDLNDDPQTINTVTYTTSTPIITAGSGNVSYAWSVSANGLILSNPNATSINVRWTNTTNVPQTGTVTVTHTSQYGCATSHTLVVTVNPLPNPDVTGPTSVCQNSLHTYSTPGFPGHIYNWTVTGGNIIRSGQGSPNVTVEWTLPGSYTLAVTETNVYGCPVTNNLYVTVNELPTATILASGSTDLCQGQSVTLEAPVGFASYVWSNGATARSIVVQTPGDYYVIVTDENGCSNSSDTITVNYYPSSTPVISLSGPTTFCEGGSVTLTAPAGFDAYLWSTGETTQSIVVTTGGTYTVTVTASNGCTATSTEVDVFVNPKPAPTLTVVGSTTVCSGDSVEVRAPQGYVSYTWVSTTGTNYGTERSIWVSQTDTIYCQVVDANGCVGESDTIAITVAPTMDPVITPNGPTTFCEGGSVTLEAPQGFASYYWSNGATTRTITVEDAGQYSVTVTNNVACVAVSAATDVNVNPLPMRPGIERTGDTLFALTTVAEEYQWYRNGVMIPGATEEKLVVSLPGTYRVGIADNNTCESISDGFDVILTDVNEPTPGPGYVSDLVVFPNPTSGQFTVETEIAQAGPVTIELINNLGEVVLTINEFTTGGMFTSTVEMGTLASGVYNVVLSTSNQRWTVQLVRQ